MPSKSRRRFGMSTRTAGDWAVRVVIALMLAFLGVVATQQTLATALRDANPQRAYALSPSDGRVLGAMAQSLSGADANAQDRQKADQLAVRALRSDPTVIPALVTLGIQAQLQGNISKSQQLLAYSEMLSRRDLRTQIWAIENAVAKNDFVDALRHYDIALRTSRQAPDLLFPVLGGAVTEPSVRIGLAKIMATKPRWNELFIPYVAGNGEDPLAVAALFRQIAKASVEIPPASQAILVARLLDKNPGQAWSYYASIRPGAVRTQSRDPRFTAAVGMPAPFDWVPSDNTDLGVMIQQSPSGGAIDFSVPAGNGGMLVQQIQYLPPGQYELKGHSANLDQASASSLYWQLSCGGGREIGRIDVPASSVNAGRFHGVINVPQDCAVQRLSLVARASDAPAGLAGRFDFIELQRVGK